MIHSNWFQPNKTDDLISPALLFFPDRIQRNIDHMIRISGDPGRLWPHIKTHKNAEIIGLQIEAGVDKFKCSTLAEAELLGRCEVKEALLAMQPTPIHLQALLQLINSFPGTNFSTLVDNEHTLIWIREQARASKQKIRLWMDLNNGMNRTGIIPGESASRLYQAMDTDPWIDCMGLHVYDGHIHDSDLQSRRKNCNEAMQPVWTLKDLLAEKNIEVKRIIAGGSPTFPIHAENPALDLSPGTTLLWDEGYGKNYPDLPFEPAAVLLTRIISKPAPGLICTDLGHKSLASEMNFPRIRFLNLNDCEQVSQSEEHLLIRCENEENHFVGDTLFALPTHVCPTIAKYDRAHIVENGEITGSWKISARDHNINH
jgi:D-serine deaminase-like pyridoxal phosphate-dependent protein